MVVTSLGTGCTTCFAAKGEEQCRFSFTTMIGIIGIGLCRDRVPTSRNLLKPGGMDSALPPSKAPLGTLIGRVVDARENARARAVNSVSFFAL